MAKQPSFQFYPGDWMKDPDLRRCSLFARGLLADLLCICFEASHRGRLCERDGVTPWSDEDILRSVGENNATGIAALDELLRKHVLSRDATGCVTSRRMVRDEELRKTRAEAGQSGGKQNGSKTEAKYKANGEAKQSRSGKQNGPPSSSSSSSSSAVNPPISPKGDEFPQIGNRHRDPLNQITVAQMHDWPTLMAWVKADSRINRERGGDVEFIQGAAMVATSAEEFLAMVKAGLSGNWGSVERVTQAEFKARVVSLNGKG